WPHVVLHDGERLEHDFVLPPSRTVRLLTGTADGQTHKVVWWLDLDGGDFLPFSEIVGSSPLADMALESPFGLAVGDHRLRVAIDGAPPTGRVIHVEAGDGVQEIAVAGE